MRLRNRQTKATFYTDGDLLRWTRDKRDFYHSLWACAEDSCCIVDDMFEVKLTAWASPLDGDMTVELFEQWRDELIAADKLIPYTVAGRRYFFIPTMAEHERPRNPQSPDWPLPPWVACTVTGDGRNRRCTYTFSDYSGDRSASVQTESGNRNTSPALPCPALTSPGGRAAREDGIDEKVITGDTSLPACLQTAIEVVDPPYKGTCFGYINHRCEQQFGAVLSHSELAELKAAINEGCIPGCKGDHPIDCALVIAEKLATKGATKFKTSRLWLKCVREDRMEARR